MGNTVQNAVTSSSVSPPNPLTSQVDSSGRTLGILAVAAGLGVANLYYAQPLAATMAQSIGVTERSMGAALMLSQLGYALGMILLVPLGDGRERRSVMVWTASAATLALVLMAVAPNYLALAATSFALGFTSALPQMIVPFACGVVPSEARGRAIGIVMGGLLAGVLLSRMGSGTLASVVGWRLTFVGAAGIMASLTLVLRFALPRQLPPEKLAWTTIMASLGNVLRGEPLLQRHAIVGAMGFATFSVFWSTLSFHLARLGDGSQVAGMFGAIGIVGVAMAPLVGRSAGRIRPTLINAVALAAAGASYAVFYVGARSLWALGFGVVLLDAGIQSSHLANQTVIFGLRPALRNRLNAVYMVTYFLGGALGTAIASFAWSRAGWPGVCTAGGVLSFAGILPLVLVRSRAPTV